MEISDLKNNLSEAKILKNIVLSQGRSYTWIANSLGYSVGHIRNVLTERDTLTEKIRLQIIKLLETNY